ncbi:MAG: hypothetical protein JO301_11960 [Chitinophagaceae bacterium]|nr:hypothetical protein [Chitinophagaceae bacterium]
MARKQNVRKAAATKFKHQSPENKDNLDSRHNEEWQSKGDDTTHNRKQNHSANRKKHE